MRWSEHTTDWMEGCRPCTKCGCMLPFSAFHKDRHNLYGVHPVCRECRKPSSRQRYKETPLEHLLWYRAKRRAKISNITFTITAADIIIPIRCPVFNKVMRRNTAYAPSLDRLNSKKGYVPGNIVVMSTRANLLKNDGTLSEFKQVVRFLEKC